VDIFFIATSDEGRELSGVKVEHADRKSVVQIAREVAEQIQRIRSGEDTEFGRAKSLLDNLPNWALRRLLRFLAYLTIDLDLDLTRFGLPRQAFGSAMVTSVGMFGIRKAYAPLSPYYRVPFLVLVGEVQPRPVAVAGRVEVRPIVTLCVTLDHRYVDAFHAGRLSARLLEYCAAPQDFEPPPAEADEPASPETPQGPTVERPPLT
jgi:pyruvate/2-oxoglutarate dehydrogenase complex dihydrolipoamide acyltransferase (E2) component